MFQFHWPSHRMLLALALPMILSNITVPLLGLVDAAVVGHLSQSYYLGGVAVGAMVINFIFWMAGFLRMATTGVTAQAFGQGDSQLQLQRLLHGVVLAIALASLILLLQWPIQMAAFALAGGSDPVQLYGQQYFSIRIYSAPAALVNYVLLGWMLGMQSAKGPMWHLIITNVVNIVLDVVFVFGLEWGVSGVAIASVIADYVGVLVGGYFVWMLAIKNGIRYLPERDYFKHKWHEIKPLMLLNRDIFLRTLLLMVCFAFMTFSGAKLGDDIVAANAILQNLLTLMAFALDGIAYAVEALVGKAVGKQSRSALVKSIKVAAFWSLVFAALFSLTFGLAGQNLITLISDIPSVIATATIYLPWIILIPLISCWCFLLDGVFIGLTRAKDMRNAMFISTGLGFFGVWWLLQSWGNHALWAAMVGFMAMRGLTLAWRLYVLLKDTRGDANLLFQ